MGLYPDLSRMEEDLDRTVRYSSPEVDLEMMSSSRTGNDRSENDKDVTPKKKTSRPPTSKAHTTPLPTSLSDPIDLTALTPSPPTRPLPRPRAIPSYSSSQARSAFTPPRSSIDQNQDRKPLHPFFKLYTQPQLQTSASARAREESPIPIAGPSRFGKMYASSSSSGSGLSSEGSFSSTSSSGSGNSSGSRMRVIHPNMGIRRTGSGSRSEQVSGSGSGNGKVLARAFSTTSQAGASSGSEVFGGEGEYEDGHGDGNVIAGQQGQGSTSKVTSTSRSASEPPTGFMEMNFESLSIIEEDYVVRQTRTTSTSKISSGKGKMKEVEIEEEVVEPISGGRGEPRQAPVFYTPDEQLELFSHKTYRPPTHKASTLSLTSNSTSCSSSTTLNEGPNPYSPPKIAYTQSSSEASDLLSMLQGPILGFDLEWPVYTGYSKKNGKSWMNPGKTALVQVCDQSMVVLIHLSKIDMDGQGDGIPWKLREILEDPKIFKIGVQVRGDGQKLSRDYTSPPLLCRGLLDLSHLARVIDPIATGPGNVLISLAKLSKAYLGYKLHKGDVRTSDWSKSLSKGQVEYAANDVYASIQIYNRLMEIASEQGMAPPNFTELASDLYQEQQDLEKVIPKIIKAKVTTKSVGKKFDVREILEGEEDVEDGGEMTLPTPSSTSGIGATPSKMRAFVLFSMDKSLIEICQAMRTKENPLAGSTVAKYLFDVVSSDPTLTYDKQRMLSLFQSQTYLSGPMKKFVKELQEDVKRERQGVVG